MWWLTFLVSLSIACGRIGIDATGSAVDATDSADTGPDPSCASLSVPGACVWNGLVSTSWADAANWSDCQNAAPGPTSRVYIDPTAPNAPRIGTATTVFGFDGSPICQGTVTVAATLTILDTDPAFPNTTDTVRTFGGSVRFEGSSPTCVACFIDPTESIIIRDGAHVTLGPGITVRFRSHRGILVGTTSSAGHLAAEGGSGPEAEWPRIIPAANTGGDDGLYGIRLRGASSIDRSSLSIDGLVIGDTHDSTPMVHLTGNADLLQLDRFHMISGTFYEILGRTAIEVLSCDGTTLVDTSWEDLDFNFAGVLTATVNIATECDPGARVTVTASGVAAGASYEYDPFNIVDW